MARIGFNRNKDEYGWMSNMSPYHILFNPYTYRTSEALFQALRFSDNEIQALIRAEKSPMDAKKVAKSRTSEMTVEMLSEKDVHNMEMCLRLKLRQHPELIDKLVATGDAIIFEDVTTRGDVGSNLFWGAMLVEDELVGQNVLGKLWMKLRDYWNKKNDDNQYELDSL